MERSQQNGRAADCGHGSGPPQGSRALHRIRTVRRQQGISIQGAARKLRIEPTKLRAQEESNRHMEAMRQLELDAREQEIETASL